jgi:hypothetical protein
MVQPANFDGGFQNSKPFLDDDYLPLTLIPVLKYLFSRITPETIASVKAFNGLVEQSQNLQAGCYLDNSKDRGAHPTCGPIEYDLLGTTIRRIAFVDTAYQFQTFARVIQCLGEADMARFCTKMSALGGRELLGLRLTRPIEYYHYRYRLALESAKI